MIVVFQVGYFRTIKLPDTIYPVSLSQTFYNDTNLVEIQGIIDVSNIKNSNMSYTFRSSPNLEKVYIKGLNSPGLYLQMNTKLIKECLLYLFQNALQQTATRTLVLGPDNMAKCSAEELAIITNKGFTIS